MEYFRTVEDMQQRRRIREFEDLRGKDVSSDLRKNSVERLLTTTFDTRTTWPEKDKLPPDFNPEQVLEEGKNPGLGIRELHERGITGRGVKVAIIDQKLLTDHEEYKDKLISYTEYGSVGEQRPSMHGPAVASLLVGERCGVAPGAELYFAATQGNYDLADKAKALDDIVEYNKTLDLEKKIRVVSISRGYMKTRPEPGQEEWINAIQRATNEGIIVIDVGIGERLNLNFTGGGSVEDRDDIESYTPWLHGGDEKLNTCISQGDIDGIIQRAREIGKKEKRSDILVMSDTELKKIAEGMIQRRKNEIVVPSDHRTMASQGGVDEYKYDGKGGLSWSTPYLAGIFALTLQVNPDLKQEEIIEMIHESAITNKKGLRIINPKGVIELARGRIKN